MSSEDQTSEGWREPGENSHPSVQAVRWTQRDSSRWLDVEVRFVEETDDDLGVSATNAFGETMTTFAELRSGTSQVSVRLLLDEPIYSLVVESREVKEREDAATYLHMVRAFYLGDPVICRPGECEHVLELGSTAWAWTAALDAHVLGEAMSTDAGAP